MSHRDLKLWHEYKTAQLLLRPDYLVHIHTTHLEIYAVHVSHHARTGVFIQGPRQIVDILTYVFKETATLGKKSPKNMPIVEKIDVDDEKIDDVVRNLSSPNSAPILVLFFDKNNVFRFADVAADDCVIHLQAGDVVKAIVGYIAVYFVFHIGFATPHGAFLSFLQEVLLKVEQGGKKTSVVTHFMHTFQKELMKKIELKGFKKHALNG